MRSHVSAQLLPHPFEVRRHDMDPCVMDTTPEHRARMRKILYGERQKPVAGTGRESGNFHANYGDEVPPKWRSTTDAEYDRKVSHQILDNNNQNKESSKYMRESHFSLEAHEEPGAPMSLTKKDYCGKDPKAAQRANYRAVSEGHSTYPPIFRDENELVMHRGKEMPHTRQRPAPVGRFERKPMIDSSAASKSTTHFSLGDDITVWESVTSAAMKRHSLTSKPPPSEYESLEKSKSTVLDNPDLVLEPMQSVQRRDFSLSDSLDRSTLKVDNTLSIRDLKSTHFTLGTDDSGHQTSQYQATFGASAAESAELARNHKRLAQSQPASKLCIIAEDFEDRRMGTSSQREDFRDPKLRASAGHSRRKIEEIKKINSQSSITLGLDSAGLSNDSRSVTRSDFNRPAEKPDGGLALEAYKRHGRPLRPEMRSYNPLSVEDIPMDKMSATHSQFRPPPSNPLSDPLMSAPAAGAIARDAEDHRIYLKASHFEIGTDEDAAVAEGRRQSTTMRHFVNPQSLAHTVRREGAGASGLNGSHTISRRNERFEETLDNTITRYPGSNERLTMTSNSRYGQFAQPKRTVPHRPPAQDTMSAYLHPAVVPSVEQQDGSVRFEPIRDFSTVSRRTFVAPEVVIAQAS